MDRQERLARLKQLTARQLQVLRLRCQGKSLVQIGQTLFITERTVKDHMALIYEKLGVDELTKEARLLELADFCKLLDQVQEPPPASLREPEPEPEPASAATMIAVLDDEVELARREQAAIKIWDHPIPEPELEHVGRGRRSRRSLWLLVLLVLFSTATLGGVIAIASTRFLAADRITTVEPALTTVPLAPAAGTAVVVDPTPSLPAPTSVATPAPTGTPTAAEAWEKTLAQLNPVWEKDWLRAIAIIDGYLAVFPDYPPARTKLYDGLVISGKQLASTGKSSGDEDKVKQGIALLARAQTIVPNDGQAAAALVALTPTPRPVPTAPTAVPPTLTRVPPTATTVPSVQVGDVIPVNQGYGRGLGFNWNVKLVSVEILADERVRANFTFICTTGSFCETESPETRQSAWIEDSKHNRYPMLVGSGSILEEKRPEGKNNDTFNGFLIYPLPDLNNMPITIYYKRRPFENINLTRLR